MRRKKVIGYLRVSTIDQDTEKNEAHVLKFANSRDFGKVHFITETISGGKSWKVRKLAEVVDQLSENDILIVPELSRLGRSLIDILDCLKVLTEKKVKVYSVKENFQLNGEDMQSKIMRTMLGLFAEIEKDLISMRTKEGLARARAEGRISGRPKNSYQSKLDKHKDKIVEAIKSGVMKNVIAKRFNAHPATLSSWLKKNKLNKIRFQN